MQILDTCLGLLNQLFCCIVGASCQTSVGACCEFLSLEPLHLLCIDIIDTDPFTVAARHNTPD